MEDVNKILADLVNTINEYDNKYGIQSNDEEPSEEL